MKRTVLTTVLLVAGGLGSASAAPVLLEGVVPDEATRQAIVTRATAVFGAVAIEDRLRVGPVAAPPGGRDGLLRLLDPALRQVRDGHLEWRPGALRIEGVVADEAARRELLQTLAAAGVTPTDGLRLRGSDAGVEFEPGSARLTAPAQRQLDAVAARLAAMPAQRLAIVGHTDDAGSAEANLALSLQRAEAVRSYLADHGVEPRRLDVRGAGAAEPRADNTTPEGRARNRRIELRAVD